CAAVRCLGPPAGHDRSRIVSRVAPMAPKREPAAQNESEARNEPEPLREREPQQDREQGLEKAPTPAGQRSSIAVLRALWPFMAPYRARVAVAAIALLVAAAATLVVPLAFRQMIDIGFAVPSQEAQRPSAAGAADVNVWFLALFAVAVVLALGTALRYYSVS